jgi:hypothetical protein
MGGFKEGTVDGWDDEEDAEQKPEAEPTTGETDASEASSDSFAGETESEPAAGTTGNGAATTDIPWILRRNSITDGREQTVQLHLQADTMNVQRTQKSVIESRLGESVRKADLREAALLVGLQQTDDVVDVLEEWGYALG